MGGTWLREIKGNRKWASQMGNGKGRNMAEGNNGEIGNGQVKGKMEKRGIWLREVMGK